MSASLLIVSQALIQGQDGVSLHPDLFLYEKPLSAYRQTWFECDDKNPLGWYAALCESSPAALLAGACTEIPDQARQCWVASPYHAQLLRETVRVYPEGMFPWSEQDAQHLCNVLNPLLLDEGIRLHRVGAALILSCEQSMDVFPLSFGALSGKMLPNQHHEGEDGGRLNRLLSEIQMMLFQQPCEARHDRGEVDVNGLWPWGFCPWPLNAEVKQCSVATRNPFLQSIVDGRDAGLMISEAERLPELVHDAAGLPKQIVLAGEGFAVLLKKSLLAKFSKTVWKPKAPKTEAALLDTLAGMTHAA